MSNWGAFELFPSLTRLHHALRFLSNMCSIAQLLGCTLTSLNNQSKNLAPSIKTSLPRPPPKMEGHLIRNPQPHQNSKFQSSEPDFSQINFPLAEKHGNLKIPQNSTSSPLPRRRGHLSHRSDDGSLLYGSCAFTRGRFRKNRRGHLRTPLRGPLHTPREKMIEFQKHEKGPKMGTNGPLGEREVAFTVI